MQVYYDHINELSNKIKKIDLDIEDVNETTDEKTCMVNCIESDWGSWGVAPNDEQPMGGAYMDPSYGS